MKELIWFAVGSASLFGHLTHAQLYKGQPESIVAGFNTPTGIGIQPIGGDQLTVGYFPGLTNGVGVYGTGTNGIQIKHSGQFGLNVSSTANSSQSSYGIFSTANSGTQTFGPNRFASYFGLTRYTATSGTTNEVSGVHTRAEAANIGSASPDLFVKGVHGEAEIIGSFVKESRGVYGHAKVSSGTSQSAFGGYFHARAAGGTAPTGYGVYAFANADAGGTMTTSYGVMGEARGGNTRYGVYGHGRTNPGTNSNGNVHYGVYGFASNGTQNNYGVYGTATGAGSFSAYFNGTAVQNAGFWTCSDREFKTDIKEIVGAMAVLGRLAPKTYMFDRSVHAGFNLPDGRQFGLISQEVESVLPELVHNVRHPETYDADGKLLEAGFDYKAMDYQALIPILIAAHQEQQAIIEEKQEQLDVLKERIQKVEQLLTTNDHLGRLHGAARNQHMLTIAPNPFSDRTTISYSVSCECRVRLQVTGPDGKAIAVLVDSRLSEGAYTYDWNTADIAAGVYTCTLLVDGQPATEQVVKVAR